MTSSNLEKYWRKNFKIQIMIFGILFKIAFLGQKNVYFVLNILFRRRKLFLAFLEFFYIFY